jgi:hypothetical protein
MLGHRPRDPPARMTRCLRLQRLAAAPPATRASRAPVARRATAAGRLAAKKKGFSSEAQAAGLKVNSRGKVSSRPGPAPRKQQQQQQPQPAAVEQQERLQAAGATPAADQPPVAAPAGPRPVQPAAPAAAAASTSGGGSFPDGPAPTSTPQVVVDRMARRVAGFAVVPVVGGVVALGAFWYLKVGLLGQDPCGAGGENSTPPNSGANTGPAECRACGGLSSGAHVGLQGGGVRGLRTDALSRAAGVAPRRARRPSAAMAAERTPLPPLNNAPPPQVIAKVDYPIWAAYLGSTLMFGGGLLGITVSRRHHPWRVGPGRPRPGGSRCCCCLAAGREAAPPKGNLGQGPFLGLQGCGGGRLGPWLQPAGGRPRLPGTARHMQQPACPLQQVGAAAPPLPRAPPRPAPPLRPALRPAQYGILSTSWDPRREGSLWGWTEVQANIALLLEKGKAK